MKQVRFTQSLLVETEFAVEVPDDYNDEEIRAMCEDFPVTVTVDSNHDESEQDNEIFLTGLTVLSAISQSDFAILDENTTI